VSGFDVRRFAKRFLMGETHVREPSAMAYLQSLEESVKAMSGRSQSESRRLELALEAIKGVRRHYRRMMQENKSLREERDRLQEQLIVLEGNSNEE
jgi:regulator of replication initiation timing